MSETAHRTASGLVAALIAVALAGVAHGQVVVFLGIGLVLGVAVVWFPVVFGSFPGFHWRTTASPSPAAVVRGIGWSFLLALLALSWLARASSQAFGPPG